MSSTVMSARIAGRKMSLSKISTSLLIDKFAFSIRSRRGLLNFLTTAGNARVNRLTNSGFKLGEIARQVNRNLTLFTIYRAEFHAQFYPLAIGFAAAVASHAAHSHLAFTKSREMTNRNNRASPLIFRFMRSEEHTSELQSHSDLVCRLLLE